MVLQTAYDLGFMYLALEQIMCLVHRAQHLHCRTTQVSLGRINRHHKPTMLHTRRVVHATRDLMNLYKGIFLTFLDQEKLWPNPPVKAAQTYHHPNTPFQQQECCTFLFLLHLVVSSITKMQQLCPLYGHVTLRKDSRATGGKYLWRAHRVGAEGPTSLLSDTLLHFPSP